MKPVGSFWIVSALLVVAPVLGFVGVELFQRDRYDALETAIEHLVMEVSAIPLRRGPKGRVQLGKPGDPGSIRVGEKWEQEWSFRFREVQMDPEFQTVDPVAEANDTPLVSLTLTQNRSILLHAPQLQIRFYESVDQALQADIKSRLSRLGLNSSLQPLD